MTRTIRMLRIAVAAPLVLLANVFDLLSSALHHAVDRVAPDEAFGGAPHAPGAER